MRFAFSILLFTLAASLREKDTSDVSHVSLSQPDGVPEVMENGGFTETWMWIWWKYVWGIWHGWKLKLLKNHEQPTIWQLCLIQIFLPPYYPDMVLCHVKQYETTARFWVPKFERIALEQWKLVNAGYPILIHKPILMFDTWANSKEQDTASIALWIMGCYNSELEMFSKCIADECNKHLERKGYQAMVFTGSLGHSAVQEVVLFTLW